jgi:hypothetical protein
MQHTEIAWINLGIGNLHARLAKMHEIQQWSWIGLVALIERKVCVNETAIWKGKLLKKDQQKILFGIDLMGF